MGRLGLLSATAAAVEFVAFGVAGVLVTLLTAPVAIVIDAGSFVLSAVLLGGIRRAERPPPPAEDRQPVVEEIVDGLRLVGQDKVLLGLVGGSMGLAAMWGVFGATWLLFVTDELDIQPAIVGVIAAVGGAGALIGAVVAERAAGRFGLGSVLCGSMLLAGLSNLLIPLAPSGLPALAIPVLLASQVFGDTAVTAFTVTEVSVRQARVGDHQLGRVNATVGVLLVLAQLAATLLGGLLAEVAGLRAAAFLAPVGAMAGAAVLWFSPVRKLGSTDVHLATAGSG